MTSIAIAVVGLGALRWFVVSARRRPASARCAVLYQRSVRSRAPSLPPFVRDRLHAADFSDDQARSGIHALRIGGGFAICIGFVVGLPVAIVLAAATVVSLGLVIFARRNRRDQRLLLALPEALELVSRSLRSGSSLLQALTEVSSSIPGPLGSALERVVLGVQRGESVTHALQRLASRTPISEVRVAVAALSLAAESGAGPSQALDGVGSSLRDSHRLRVELGALTSQARTSALVLIALPFVFVGINAAVDPSALAFLFEDDAGRVCLVAGLALDAIGWVWMNGLVRRVQA